MDGIVLMADLYYVENFKFYNKHMRMLAKKVGQITRNISTKILVSQLEEIQKNQELVKLEKLVSKNEDQFTKTLQWAIQTKRVIQQLFVIIKIFYSYYRY